ncbi:MAG: hypothetical protein KDD11_03265 [Acidobacteria bacterium]|nr:hypothetical protein [Acidobacteriota bacterium]
MKSFRLLPLLAAATLVLAAPSLFAEEYTVKLQNGTEFRTLRQPEQASWDSSMAMLLTDAGNWIGVPKADITDISTRSEARGLGRVIDSKTLEIGASVNDAPTDEELEEAGKLTPDQAFLETMNLLKDLAQQPDRPNVTVEQFVNPEDTTGVPTSVGNEGLAQEYYGTGYEP